MSHPEQQPYRTEKKSLQSAHISNMQIKQKKIEVEIRKIHLDAKKL